MERQTQTPVNATVAAAAAATTNVEIDTDSESKSKSNEIQTPLPLQLHNPFNAHGQAMTMAMNASATPTPGSMQLQMPFGQQIIHSMFGVLFDDSTRRLSKRQGAAISFELKYDTEVKRYHFVNLFYQMHVGAVGGVTCGVETGLFSQCFAPANSAALLKLKRPGLRKVLRNADVIRTVASRALVAGLLFNFLDSKMEQHRNKKDWKNFAAAGLISGAIFGTRGGGGVRAATIGSVGFGAFAALAGFFDGFFRKISS